MTRLGMHSVTDQIPFAPGTPSVEASWAFNAYVGLGLREGVERVLAQKRRGVRPILRVDYAPGQTRQDFIAEVGSVRRLSGHTGHRHFTVRRAEHEGRGRFCGGAHRRLRGGVYRPVSRCARLGVRDACARVGGRGADAASVQRAVAVGGVFLPATVPSERARRHPHGFLVHGYARPGEPHTPEGWRFSDTVIETWDECLRHFPAYRDKPVIVSEWNCPTGGLTTADQYRPGGLAGDLTYTGQLYGIRAEAFCVFVGRSDNSWPDDCLLDSRGRCVRMRSDYDHLKAAGF